MLKTEAVDSKFPEKKFLTESLDSKPDISDEISLSAEQESRPSERSPTGDSVADKATEAEHLQKVDKLSQQETETDAAISEGHLQRDKVPETQGDKGSDEQKLPFSISKDSDRDGHETLQEAALKSEVQASSLKTHEESVLHAESEIISDQSDDHLNIHASPAHHDEDLAGKGLPADTNRIPPVDGTLDKSVSPKPSSSSEVEKEVTKQELYLSLDAAPDAVPSVYSKAKELLEECVGATDSTSPGGALSTGSPKSSVSEDSFRSVLQKDDSRDVLVKEEQGDDGTCDESVLPASGVTTGYDFRSPTEVLRRDFLEETSHTVAKELDVTTMLPSPSQDEEGRQLLEIIKSQLVTDESADYVTTKEHDLPRAKDIPPADSSKHVPSGTHTESGDTSLGKSPDSTTKRDEMLSTILDQITKDDWDGLTHSEPDKIQVSETVAELQSRLLVDSTTKFQPDADVPLGSEDQREPSGSGHLLVKGAPEEEESVPVPSELSTAVHKPESPSAPIEDSEEIRPETSLLQESGSITRKDSKTGQDRSAVPESHISQSSPADDSLLKLSEERVPHLPSDLDTSSATDPSSSPVALKESASHPDVQTIGDTEEPGSEPDLKIATGKGVVCDSRLSSGPEGTKARDEAPHAEAGEKETASRGSPSLIHQEQESYVPEAPWVHHHDSKDARSSEISDQPMKDPRAMCPTSLDAPELAHMQQRVSVDYDSSITSVSDIEFAVDAKAFRAAAPDDSSHDDSKTEECPEGEKGTSRPSSPESPPQSPVKRIAAEHPRASKRARTTSESKHPISTQGSSEADISSEDEDSTRRVTAASYTDTPCDGVELPKYSPQSELSSLPPVDDDGVAMQAYIERRLSDSDRFTDKKQRASPPSETVSASLEGIPTPERKTSKSFDDLHLNGTSHSPPSVGLVAGLAAGLATELICMPQSAEELCIDSSESRWPPAQGSRIEIMPPEMTASIYEERPEHIEEKPCSETDVESVGRGTPDSPGLHRTGQIPVQREVITTVTSRRVVYQNDGPPDTWTTSTFSEPTQQDTDDDSRRTTVTYVYRTYTSAEDDNKDDPLISSGTVPSRQGEDGLPFEILRSAAQRHAREEDGHDDGDQVTGTSSRSYVYTVSSDHGAPDTFIHHTDDTGTLHHPDSSIHSIAMDEVARITEMAAAAVSQSPNGWTVVHRSADSSSQRPLELTRPSELAERRNGHVTHVTETRQIVYQPSSSAEMRFPMASSAEETCLPPEGSDPKTILEFMAAQTKQAAKEMLEEQPLYEEDEEGAQEQSSLSDASPLVEEPVFGKTLQPDYPELVELSAANTPSEPPSPHSAVHDTRARHNGEPSGTTASVQRLVVVEETMPASTVSGGSEARRVVSYVEEPTTVVREEWVLEGGRGEASHVISQSSMFQHEVLTREELTSADTTSSPASTGDDALRFAAHHHPERGLGTAGDTQRPQVKLKHPTIPSESYKATSAERQANGRRDGDTTAPFDIRDWGKPLGLPVPPDPSSKSSKTKKAGAAATPRGAADVVYVDLTYVPHHGDPGYCDVEFFSRVRARYYVLSGTNPSQQVLDALLEAKRGWGEPDAPVTVIPTYETDALCYWIAHNQKALEEHHIDVAPSASRCTINLQDHESSCAAYRLEF
ncbi:hypothetical protein MTO96_023695 [Rhipicephalus appendiculatus]